MSGDYVCNICGKQFLTKGGLSSHNWAVHNTVESPCTVCDKIFTNKKHLAVHMSNTHAENQRFSCDFKTGESACSYYSTTKSNLRAHKKRVHEKNNWRTPFLQNMRVVCVATAPTVSSAWADIEKSAIDLWIKIPSITFVTSAPRSFLQRRF